MIRFLSGIFLATTIVTIFGSNGLAADESQASIDRAASSQAAPLSETSDSLQSADSAEPKYPGLLTHLVKVAKTDPALTIDHRAHWAYLQPGIKKRGQLLVYLPGTHGTGRAEHAFNALAAQMGYHVLSLTYISGIAVAIFRKSGDRSAFSKGRDNIIYGTAPIADLHVDPANSIFNRLVKALSYLDKTYPNEGWGAYLDGDQPVWSKLVLAGLSQGGGHACFVCGLAQ